MQQAVNEFWASTTIKKTPCKIYKVIENDVFSIHAQQILIPYLINKAPPFALEPGHNANFKIKLLSNLRQIKPINNYFTCLDIPVTEMYRFAYYICRYEKNYSVIEKGKDLYGFIAQSLGFNYSQDGDWLEKFKKLGPYKKIEKMILKELLGESYKQQIKSAGKDIAKYILLIDEYYDNNFSLFDTLLNQTLRTTGEFIPDIYEDKKGRRKLRLVILSATIQDMWLEAVAAKDPKSLVRKVVKFGRVGISTKNRISESGNMLIGIEYPEVPTFGLVHKKPAKALAYTYHDLRFHYPVLFYLRAHANYIFQLQLRFIDVIRKITKLKNCRGVNEILDFANPFFYVTYEGNIGTSEILSRACELMPLYYAEHAAMQEYVLIVVCDMVKNPAPYMDIIKDIPGGSGIQLIDLINAIYSQNSYIFKFIKGFILNSSDLIKKYSHSLVVFLCLLQLKHLLENNLISNDKMISKMLSIAEKLHQLEKVEQIQFLWNMNDGLMLNIDNNSFRFRKVTSPPSDARVDYRYSRIYKPDDKLRFFSNETDWVERLDKILSHKLNAENSLTLKHEPQLIAV